MDERTQPAGFFLEPPFAKDSIPLPLPDTTPSLHSPTHNGGINSQPALASMSSVPLTALESLPTISGKGNHGFLVEDDITQFINYDLDLSRLNVIHDQLWSAGRPMRARPLHRYKMMGHEILCTQQMDLHLLKYSNKLLLKPLSEYLLSYEFWTMHICISQSLHESASGFLLSYVWLVTSPLDLEIAKSLFLMPSYITWPQWKGFVRDFTSRIDINALDQVNKRYHFGDLRLGRINSIYRTRFIFSHFVRGYLYQYNRYVVFFQRNFSWILIVFVFFSLVLSAMQVGAGLPPLQDNEVFRRTSYGFVVFSMVCAAAVLAFVGVVFVVVFFYNMVQAISHDKAKRRERQMLAERRGQKKDA